MSTVKEAVDIEVPVRTAYGRLARARPARESWFGHLATWDAKPRSRTGIPGPPCRDKIHKAAVSVFAQILPCPFPINGSVPGDHGDSMS